VDKKHPRRSPSSGLLAVEDRVDEFAKRCRTALKGLSVPLYCYVFPIGGLIGRGKRVVIEYVEIARQYHPELFTEAD